MKKLPLSLAVGVLAISGLLLGLAPSRIMS